MSAWIAYDFKTQRYLICYNTVRGYRVKKNIVFGLLILGSAVSLSFFQNCSKIVTADLQKSTDASLNAFNESAPVVSSDTLAAIVTVDEPTNMQSGVNEVSQPEVMVADADGQPETKQPEVKVADEVEQPEIKTEEKSDDKSEVKVVKEEEDEEKDEEDVDTSSETEAIAACLDKGKKITLTGSMFSDLHGKHRIVSDQIAEIRDSRGKLLVRPKTDRSRVDKISNFHGKLILCNADVDLIEKVHGKLILINSHVKEILGHKGKVKSMNSTILKFDGKFKLVTF